MTPTPPHSTKWERRLLAALLREPQLTCESIVRHSVTESDLYLYPHRLVWRAAWDLVDSGSVPTLADVWQVLTCRNEMREVTALWLANLYDADPTGAWAEWACRVVKYKARQRAVIRKANEMLRDAARLSPEECEAMLG